MKKEFNPQNQTKILEILAKRFDQNRDRHKNLKWDDVLKRLENNSGKLNILYQMEMTGGEPDVVDFVQKTGEFIFIDCAKESPAGRRSLCYDRKALEARKANKPAGNAMDFAAEIGIRILTEEQYRKYHPLVGFDNKTSSWVLTPDEVRALGGAVFCDYRFGRIFTYHNGAESYYASRGFRGLVKV